MVQEIRGPTIKTQSNCDKTRVRAGEEKVEDPATRELLFTLLLARYRAPAAAGCCNASIGNAAAALVCERE